MARRCEYPVIGVLRHTSKAACEAIACFVETGAVDLIGINGYYAMLAMVMNAARTPLP